MVLCRLGGLKTTVSGVFEDLKFKISEETVDFNIPWYLKNATHPNVGTYIEFWNSTGSLFLINETKKTGLKSCIKQEM